MDKRQMFISHVMFIQKYTVIKHLVNPGFKWNCYGRDIMPSKQQCCIFHNFFFQKCTSESDSHGLVDYKKKLIRIILSGKYYGLWQSTVKPVYIKATQGDMKMWPL